MRKTGEISGKNIGMRIEELGKRRRKIAE